MYIQYELIFTILILVIQTIQSQSNLVSPGSLEDDVQYVFKWPGHLFNLEDDMKQNIDLFDITTNNMEKYKCAIPVDLTDEELNKLENDNKILEENPIVTSSLFESIYSKKFCSYRIESYWIYELCHGQFVKQYHETKNSGKRVVNEEYFLGYYNADKQEPDYINVNGKPQPNIHWRTLDGQRVATYAVKYTGGTACEVLTNTQREITIFYACDENGNDNIATFEEVSSCVYEMIIVTKWICSHPAYKLPEKNKKTISCYSLENSPVQPYELSNIELEKSLSIASENKIQMTNQDGSTFIIHYKTIDDDSTTTDNTQQETVNNEPAQTDQSSSLFNNNIEDKLNLNHHTVNEAEKKMIIDFLSGEQCLNGGQGWWKYEVCLGKHVMQYHEDEQTKRRNNVLLGTWNTAKHLDWIEKHPSKRPLQNKGDRMSLSLYYSDGDICDNKKRFVEVKLRCVKPSEKSHAISLYLIEPATCEYLVSIESTWLCDYIEKYDGNIKENIND